MSTEQLSPLSSPQKKTKSRHFAAKTGRVTRAPIAVIGLGYVGLPLAILAASRGFRVVGFDIDRNKITKLAQRQADFLNEEERDHFKKADTLSVTYDEESLNGVETFIVCVPTPVHENRLPDLRPLESACAIVGRHVTRGSLVVIESTVSPGVCEEVALPIIEFYSGLSRKEFDFAHCPERINPGDDRWGVRSIPRVIGALDKKALKRAESMYVDILETTLFPMNSIREAEAVKMIENAFRDVNIAFVNELAIAFDRAGIDVVNVIRGASTKPFGFMPFYPGCGVGGHCIPVDPYYLIRYGRENGFEHTFLVTARRINNRMPEYTIDVLEKALNERGKKLSGSTVAVLGLAYKRDVPDMRESPAVEIRDTLVRKGTSVRTFDPFALAQSSTRDMGQALDGADAVVIATDHSLFRSLTPQNFENYDVDVVIDGRNCLDKALFAESNIICRGIGRG